MKKMYRSRLPLLLLLVVLVCHLRAVAQAQTYDLVTYTPPKGWTKAEQGNIRHYQVVNNSKGTWARISLVKSTASKGKPEDDFSSEWDVLAVKMYGVAPEPLGRDTQIINGWTSYTGLCRFRNKKDTVSMLVNTFSNGQRCFSLLLQSNTTAYGPAMDAFLASLQIPAATTSAPPKQDSPAPAVKPAAGTAGGGWQFSTTSFEDGWTSSVKEDWVEATRGKIRVLLHYPRAEDQKYYAQYAERVQTFWNLLIAPRYSNLREYQSPPYSNDWQPGYFAAGWLTDKATGKDVWVALFSQGKSGWMEVIAPDKQTFVEQFGVDRPDQNFDDWKRLSARAGRNRFAVGEQDLNGLWTNSFTSSSDYYSVYTGFYAGSTNYGARENFTFGPNRTYQWEIWATQSASGAGSRTDHAKSAGTWRLSGNWQIAFPDIQGRPKTYQAYFSCFKGGRLLWLQPVGTEGYTAFGKVGK